MLNIISSNFGGFNSFNAKFSKETEKIILYGGFISFMIEDLAQLVIQVSEPLSGRLQKIFFKPSLINIAYLFLNIFRFSILTEHLLGI